MKISLIKGLDNRFTAAYDSDHDMLKKIKAGEVYEYEYKKPRNYKFHKKFFALINLVFQNQDRYSNMEYLRRDLIIEAGYFDEHFDLQGTQQITAKSISFAKMDETEFDKLYQAVLNTIVKYFHFDKQEIEDNIQRFY
jgi:hypothetical protein